MEKLGNLLSQWLDEEITLQLHKRGFALLGTEEQKRIEGEVVRRLEAINAFVEDKKTAHEKKTK